MNTTDRRLEKLAARARSAGASPPDAPPFGFATRVLASVKAAPAGGEGDAALWARFSLASLPLAALAAAGCLYWISAELEADASDLAQQFVGAPLMP